MILPRVALALAVLVWVAATDPVPLQTPQDGHGEAETYEDIENRVEALQQRLAAVQKHADLIQDYAYRYGIGTRMARQIIAAARENDIPVNLAFGLVKVESGFNPRAVSHVGAMGLTQLMPGTAAGLKPGITREQTFDPETNLRLGFKHLNWLLQRYNGNKRLALLAYNRGHGTIERVMREGQDPGNGYASWVMREAD